MKLASYKKSAFIIIGGLIIIAVILSYAAINQSQVLLNDNVGISSVNDVQAKESSANSIEKTESIIFSSAAQAAITEANNVSNDDTNYPTIIGSPLNRKIIADWHRSRGYYVLNNFDEAIDEYASFDIETLRQLKEAGDMRASSHYMRKLSDGSKEGYFKMRDEAMVMAAKGSIEALHLCGFLTRSSDGRYAGVGKRENELDYLVWYKAAELRGNRLPMIEAYGLINSGYTSPLSKTEWQQVDDRAQELYQNLLKKREEMGLGDFDNSAPKVVKKFFHDMGGDMYYND